MNRIALWRSKREPTERDAGTCQPVQGGSRVDEVIEALRREAGRGQFAWSARQPAQPPHYAAPSRPVAAPLATALSALGVERLYTHQATAIDAIRGGENVAIVTPTASGKTLAFNVPILERLLAQPAARALYLYPTNALANDQESGLRTLLDRIENAPYAGVLTGATDAETRRLLRSQPPQLLLTNPEMLHLSLLGAHRSWSRFLGGLQFVVLDELHLYRGLFGAHLAMVMRRLLRIAALYGARPQIIACSATIGNPAELAERIAGRPFTVIEGSGAARGPRTFVVWRPRLLRSAGSEERADPQGEAVNLFCRLVSEGLGTILFALTRRGAETMLIQARERLGPALGARIAPYRNGYSPDQRRLVEERLKTGELLGVVSTNALEVGIDIGGLDAAVIAGFPGSRTSLWQQAGRAGRGTRSSLVAFVPYERVVDGYYAAHSEELLEGKFEDAIVDLANPSILAAHLACAAAERELRDHELAAFSPAAADAAGLAQAEGLLNRSERGWRANGENLHRGISLRGGTSATFEIEGASGPLGTIDEGHVYREAYPGALYLHEGVRYRVTALDAGIRRVLVMAEPGVLVTEPVLQTTVHVEGAGSVRLLQQGKGKVQLATGPLRVRQTTTAFREIRLRGRHFERTVPLSPPLTHELVTSGCWLVVPPAVRAALERRDPRRFVAGLHALEHILPAAVSLRLLCDARDVVATYEVEHAALGGPALFLFDDYAGGAGIAMRAAAVFEELLLAGQAIIGGCPCRDGCPSCILSASCWRRYDDLDKSAAVELVSALLGVSAGDRAPRP